MTKGGFAYLRNSSSGIHVLHHRDFRLLSRLDITRRFLAVSLSRHLLFVLTRAHPPGPVCPDPPTTRLSRLQPRGHGSHVGSSFIMNGGDFSLSFFSGSGDMRECVLGLDFGSPDGSCGVDRTEDRL